MYFFINCSLPILEALGGTKSQMESLDGEETLTQLYSKALHDLGNQNKVFMFLLN